MAEVSANYVKSVLATLPVGYYLGTRAEVSFSETAPTSYCQPLDNRIVISLSNVANAMAEVKTSDPAKIEEYTRGCLYHEVSHLILTPRGMYSSPSRNIVEDERIETRLRKYYRDVNFRELLLKINHWTPSWKPTTCEEFFFGIVRYHSGPKDLVDRAVSLIGKHITLKSSSSCWEYCSDIDYFYNDCCKRFKEEEEAREAANSNSGSNGGDGNSSQESGSDGNSEDSSSSSPSSTGDENGSNAGDNEAPETGDDDAGANGKAGEDGAGDDGDDDAGADAVEDAAQGSDEDAGDDDAGSGEAGDDTAEDEEDEASLGGATPAGSAGDGHGENSSDPGKYDELSEEEEEEAAIKEAAREMDEGNEEYSELPLISAEEVHDIVKGMMEKFNDAKLMAEIHRIIIRACKKRANRAGSSTGYSGKIDPRLVGTKRDYRWFVRGGNDNNKFDRVHLTLWVDCSGSFHYDIDGVNKLIASLNSVEKSVPGMFSFDVVSMANENLEHDKKEVCKASGGNRFGPDIVELSRKLTRPGWTNYNVAVWDGDMCSNMCGCASEKIKRWLPAFRVFDNSKSVIVSDLENKKYLDKACKNSRLTYIDHDYASEFVGVVVKLLDRML